MKMLLGKKIGMTQLFLEDGNVVPVTIIFAEPNLVLENKILEKDGYNSTKVGFIDIEEKKLNSPKKGYFKKVKSDPKKIIKEFRNVVGYNVGDKITVDTFKPGDCVDVQGITKGHGFTGAIKRWGFKIGPMSHGAGYPHRYQGSISFGRGGTQGQRVPLGQRMSGHMGCEKVTISNLLVLDSKINENILLIKGAIPGPNNSVVLIKTTNKTKPASKLTTPLINRNIKKVEVVNNENINEKEEVKG